MVKTVKEAGADMELLKRERGACPMQLQSACSFRCASWREAALRLERERDEAMAQVDLLAKERDGARREQDHLWAELEKINNILNAKQILATAACRREIDAAKEEAERAKEGDTFPIVEAYRIIEMQFNKLLEVLK